MKATFKLADPKDLDATMTITMSLEDWIRLQQELTSGKYPSWKLKSAIQSLVERAHQQFYTDGETP